MAFFLTAKHFPLFFSKKLCFFVVFGSKPAKKPMLKHKIALNGHSTRHYPEGHIHPINGED